MTGLFSVTVLLICLGAYFFGWLGLLGAVLIVGGLIWTLGD